ncbi:MAG: biotin/lipoyl-binding protein [Candidatus Nitricoxidivorans perseverans]|uniref:Biotin/lipoyl-binding protein n=1 Tax=Candidatus Nitricoxidivorans perseverans TaxID=2975601 RepID=A0AA49FJW6_9PROT|nr:MAG: biotin/lipoyl-binding protein [Candidatus Nitricoxidivorans perseverans]
MRERLLGLTAPAGDFSPPILRLQQEAPSPLPRLVLRIVLGLLAVMLAWATFGRLDIVAVAQGKLVPVSYLKVIQPAESGIVAELLVREGDAVKEGQVLVRMDRHVSEADSRQIENDLAVKRLTLRRIDAELADRPMQRRTDDPPDIYAQVEAQSRARRQAYRDALDAERALLAKAEQELAAQRHAVESLKAAIEQSRKKIAQIASNYRQQLATDRVGNRYRLSPGMHVAAEIHLGTRTVLEYLLSPVRKVAYEAGRER